MPTNALANEWAPYCGQYLGAGYEVKLHPGSNRVKTNHGIVERRLRKNYSVIIDGKTWRVPPSMIAQYRRGGPDNLASLRKAEEAMPKPKRNPEGFADCSDGDILLMWRGKFDVVELIEKKQLRCKALDGRGKGNIYRYKVDQFVQKLDKSCFSVK